MTHRPPRHEARHGRRVLRCCCLALCLGLSTAGLQGQGVVLNLHNGDRISGDLVSESETHLVVTTQFGEVSIAKTLVQSRNAVPPPEPPTPAVSPDDVQAALTALFREYQEGALAPADYHRRRSTILRDAAEAGLDPVQFATAPDPPPAPAPPAASTQGGAKPKAPGKWAGQAQFGSDLGFGTKDREMFTGRINVGYTRHRFKNTADYRFAYGEADDELSANRMDGTMKTDWDMTPTYYLYNLGGAGYDEIRLISMRYEVGPGLGIHLWKDKNIGLSTEVGVNYYAEERDLGNDQERFYFRLAEILTWKINSRVNVDEKFEWFPRVEDPSQYRFRFEANVQYLLGANLSLVFTVLDQYDTSPAVGVENNDLQVRSSVGLKF